MAARMLRRLSAAALVAGAFVGLVDKADARPVPGVQIVRRTSARRTFNLFAGSPNVLYQPNRVHCNVNNDGQACTAPSGSPVGEDGFWPAGSADNYIFNSGLQIGGIVRRTSGFAWANDTVGAFFFDPRGDQKHGEGISNIYDSKSVDDLAAWPTAGMVTDTALFDPVLLGRTTASQEDMWLRYWDGNTAQSAGRKHSMGLLVDQRFMGWGYPAGNNDIMYTIVRFINITSNRRADYDSLVNVGYTPADIDAIFAIAQQWRAAASAFYNVTIPDSGFAWDSVFASYAADPDEGDATRNLSNGNLIFNTVMNYKADFYEPTWQLPPSIFGGTFAAAPGIFAIKYLATPQNTGIAMEGNTTNGLAPDGSGFPDAVGVSQLWRNLSGRLLPTDPAGCNVPGTVSNPNAAVARHQCFWQQTPVDTRIFGSSGPFTLLPGHAATTAVALVFGASVAKLPAASAPIAGNPGLPAFDLNDYIATQNGLAPGLQGAISGTRLLAGQDTVKIIDRVSGFLNYTADVNANGRIDQTEVVTVPRSLLDKEKVAQTVFDNKFLLPFAPSAPGFFLVPGDGQVTVVWQKSGSEDPVTGGNPFFTVASQPLVPCPPDPITHISTGMCPNALYDPNFRKFDVEGYRVWRGRTAADLHVVAQFDYIGTAIQDYTAEFYDEALYSNACAPELGVTTTCPTSYSLAADSVTNVADVPVPIALTGIVRQIPPGGRVELADGTIFNVSVDTAVTGGGTGYPALQDNGVPFAYIDNGLVNGVRYFYAVTAFSINSLKSGPSSLESQIIPKVTVPRASSGQETFGSLGDIHMLGADGTELDPTAPDPTISTTTAELSHAMPPTNGASLGFTAFVPQLIAASDSGTVQVVVDSVTAGYNCNEFGGNCFDAHYYLHANKVGDATINYVDVPFHIATQTGASPTASAEFPGAPVTGANAARFGGNANYSLWMLMQLNWPGVWDMTGKGRYWANCTPGGCIDLSTARPVWHGNGPRWWAGAANENAPLPNDNTCTIVSSGGCVDTTGNANVGGSGVDVNGHTNGLLPGISNLWSPEGYLTVTNPMRSIEVLTSTVFRAADFNVYWNATTAGKVDSVIDVTHHVPVPYARGINASWGILNDSSFTNATAAALTGPDGNNAFLTFTDLLCVHPIPETGVGACASMPHADEAFLMDHALSNPMNYKPASTSAAGGAALVAQGSTGNGFIFYLNGHFFVMQMATTLANCCQNTVWHARFYTGFVRKNTATGAFAFIASALWTRPPNVPGLTYRVSYTGSTFTPNATNDTLLANVHTVPDPYYVTNSLEQTVNSKILRFVNLPAQAIIRIYSASGVLVRILTHNDVGGGSEENWDLRNRNNQFVASGVYFYHVETPEGKTKIGRFTVVNYAQ